MAKKTKSKGMDTGTKVVIGLASLALLVFFADGNPDNDAWDDDSGDDVAATGGGVDPDGVELDLDEDAEGESVDAPTDDPWTRGAPAGADDDDDDDDDPEPPVDDPWTRGVARRSRATTTTTSRPRPWTTRGPRVRRRRRLRRRRPGAVRGRDRLRHRRGAGSTCRSTAADDAFASPDCTITEGQSGGPVLARPGGARRLQRAARVGRRRRGAVAHPGAGRGAGRQRADGRRRLRTGDASRRCRGRRGSTTAAAPAAWRTRA